MGMTVYECWKNYRVGEKMEDLQLFNGEEFVDSFFKKRG
jgi:hypothetical protein